ncbi:uncharacterized protein LOC136034681 [Artemia franciscana]|uniref:Uncharacterized protein n=1 Tax=Artemia franciscana TaxID=6661 RepID=A0AA88IAF5_ARTSF|nr:hypothetical protein QYM36_003240 [Artemia franciscana]
MPVRGGVKVFPRNEDSSSSESDVRRGYNYGISRARPESKPKNAISRKYSSSQTDYSDDESYSRAPSDRGMSEFTIPQDVVIESRGASRSPSLSSSANAPSPFRYGMAPVSPFASGAQVIEEEEGHSISDGIFVLRPEMKKPVGSEFSSYRTVRSTPSTKTKTSRHGRIVIETTRAPHPLCPDTKSFCCLMCLFNLGLLLVCLGFVIVLQLSDPPFVWYLGVFMLVFGFLTLIGGLVACGIICREDRVHEKFPEEGQLYWTNRWRREFNLPGSAKEKEAKGPNPYYLNESFYSDHASTRR